uniref:Uncharacterized protein n=1 Tax=Gibberella zeae TaxID=5518 RepID=A0A4E9ENG0_GIBZA
MEGLYQSSLEKIKISLDGFHFKERCYLKNTGSFNYILNATSDKLLAKISHFGYLAFSMSLIACHSGKKKLAYEGVYRRRDSIWLWAVLKLWEQLANDTLKRK